MTTSVVAPALPQIAADLHLGESQAQIAFSIFVLGQAFGPFVIAPMSEVLGRRPVWIACNIFYIFWNSICPVGKSRAVLIIGRFFSGAGASCGVVVRNHPFSLFFCPNVIQLDADQLLKKNVIISSQDL